MARELSPRLSSSPSESDNFSLVESVDYGERVRQSTNWFVGNASRGVMARDNITLQCTECKNRNYVTTKNKKKTPDRLEFKKFCRKCRSHTPHKETK